MSIQPGQAPLIPALVPVVEDDADTPTTDGGVPVGAADVDADRQNAEERSEADGDGSES